MEFVKTVLQENFIVKKIITIHYFEFNKDFCYVGEKHDFWELVYVDRGEAAVLADDTWHRVGQGKMAFHKPGEFHNLRANGSIAPNIIIVTFECKSPAMRFFQDKIVDISTAERHLLATIIKEASGVFCTPFDDVLSKCLVRSTETHQLGAEQLIKISMEQLLISIYWNNAIRKDKNMTVLKERMENDIAENVIEYLKDNVGLPLRFSDVCSYAKISPTGLRTAFKAKTEKSVMQYFRELKIHHAKVLIRENNYNMTQISELLGYENIHHFSRQFKQIAKMSPTEYARSAKLEFEYRN